MPFIRSEVRKYAHERNITEAKHVSCCFFFFFFAASIPYTDACFARACDDEELSPRELFIAGLIPPTLLHNISVLMVFYSFLRYNCTTPIRVVQLPRIPL